MVRGRGEQQDHPGHDGHHGDRTDCHHDDAAPGAPRRGFEEEGLLSGSGRLLARVAPDAIIGVDPAA